MRKPSTTPTEQELAILKIIWDLGTATVREVYEALRQEKKVAYTTVMTMVKVLEEKHYVRQKRQEGRAYVYEATKPKSSVVSQMVEDFVGRVFDGSAQPLVVGLIKDRKLSEEELREISRLIEESEE